MSPSSPIASKQEEPSRIPGKTPNHYESSQLIPPRQAYRIAKKDRAPNQSEGLARHQLVELYQYLYETRRLEEHLVALYRQNLVIGGVYRSLGQEATAVGCAYALRKGDYLQPLIRDLGAILVHGVSPIAMLRQYMAKATGPSGGRDLNTHFSDPSHGFLGPISMLGAMIPVLSGCLLASRHQSQGKVGLAFIGDGGSSTGAFYEGLNFAAVQKLPLIVVIESNGYAYSTPTEHQVPEGNLETRAKGFGIHVQSIDGNDPLAAYAATREARLRGLKGEGPTIIVAHTYRRKGHAEHDNQHYVEKTEIDAWETHNDPVKRYWDFLIQHKDISEELLNDIETQVNKALDEARDSASQDTLPDPSTLTWGVFEGDPSPFPAAETWFRGGPPHRPADLLN